MPEVASLWIGDALGEIERASVNSFLRLGQPLTIYTYADVDGIPDGVEVRDAREIFDHDEIVRDHESGSPALHSDLFRYALMAKSDAIWVDLDVIALRPFSPHTDWIIGFESAREVGSGVLRLPRSSETLKKLLCFRPDTRGVSPDKKGRRELGHRLKALFTGGTPITHWPWGAIGPRALTRYLRETGEIGNASPRDHFYAIPMEDYARFVTPGALMPDHLPEEAITVHAWGKLLREHMTRNTAGKIPDGSFLSRYV